MFSVNLSTRDGQGHAIVELHGELDVADAAARHAGGDLLLASPRHDVLRMLTLTRLIDIFTVRASVDEAAGHVRRTAATRVGRQGLTDAT